MVDYDALKCAQIIIRSFFTAYGLLGYLIVLKPLLQYRKTSFTTPFYTVCLALACTDILTLIIDSSSIITDAEVANLGFYNKVKAFLERIFWYGTECHQLLIALERTFAIFVSTTSALALNRKSIIFALAVTWSGIVGTNFCVMSADICPYIWYPNTTIVFYDFSHPGAVLHNKIVDLSIQPVIVSVTLLLYLISGLKVASIRKTVQSHNSNVQNRHVRLDHLLLFQGFVVTVPTALVVALYQVIIYDKDLPRTVVDGLDYSTRIIHLFGTSFTPYLHLLLNKDVRHKAIEVWFGKDITKQVVDKKTIMASSRRRSTMVSTNF